VLTKVDQAYAEAVGRGAPDPWAQVEQARRIGTRRFARELGRDPESVLSVTISAEAALRPEESELGRRFEVEIAKLFHLLRHERALILGARAAGAIRRCIGGIAEAEQRAEQSYRTRIEELERERMPRPEVFADERLTAAEEAMHAAAREAVAHGALVVRTGCADLKRLAANRLQAARRPRALVEGAEQLSGELSEQAAGVRRRAHLEMEGEIERRARGIVDGLVEDLRQRYHLLPEVEHSSDSSPRLGAPEGEAANFVSPMPGIRAALRAFERERYALGAGGFLTGAAAGTFVHPWLGVTGAVLGSLVAFARRDTLLRRQCLGLVTAELTRVERRYLEQVRSLEPAMVSAIRATSGRSLDRAIARFGQSITEPLEAEQRAIDEQRGKLSGLEELKAELAHHDRELDRLRRAAADASVGLCR
jgi:hypothetical protein